MQKAQIHIHRVFGIESGVLVRATLPLVCCDSTSHWPSTLIFVYPFQPQTLTTVLPYRVYKVTLHTRMALSNTLQVLMNICPLLLLCMHYICLFFTTPFIMGRTQASLQCLYLDFRPILHRLELTSRFKELKLGLGLHTYK